MGKKRRSMFNPKFKNSRPELWKLGRKLLGIPTEEELEAKRLEEARLKAEQAKLKAEQEAKLKEEKETKKKTTTKKTTKKRRTTTKKAKKED